MRRLLAALVVLAVLGAVAYEYFPEADEADEGEQVPVVDTETATSYRVLDGDSFEADEAEVRLQGINAPDRFECLAQDARRALKDLLASGPVTLATVPGEDDTDRYGRLLRYVHAGDVFVNRELVERGLALVVSADPDLVAAQQRARTAALGMWNPNACGPPASTDVRIVAVEADPPGRDDDNLNGEYAVIRNDGPNPVDMTGWKLRDDSTSNRFWFPDGFQLAPGANVTVHVGSGADSADALHWGRRYPVWDNSGDMALLLDPNGNAVSVWDA